MFLTRSINEIVSGPVAGAYICRDIGDHIFVVVDSGEWYLVENRIRWYYESFLQQGKFHPNYIQGYLMEGFKKSPIHFLFFMLTDHFDPDVSIAVGQIRE